VQSSWYDLLPFLLHHQFPAFLQSFAVENPVNVGASRHALKIHLLVAGSERLLQYIEACKVSQLQSIGFVKQAEIHNHEVLGQGGCTMLFIEIFRKFFSKVS